MPYYLVHPVRSIRIIYTYCKVRMLLEKKYPNKTVTRANSEYLIYSIHNKLYGEY